MNPLDADIKYLRGVGPKRADMLEKQLGIRTFRDLLYQFPTRYIDRSVIYTIADVRTMPEMPMVQIKGQFINLAIQGEGARRRLVGLFSDGTSTIEVVWFRRVKTLSEAYMTRTTYVLFGKPTLFNGRLNMVHPEVDKENAVTATQGGLHGIYPLTETLRNHGFSSKTFFSLAQAVLAAVPNIKETLSADVIARNRLMPLNEALAAIHNPQSSEQLHRARFRLKFEELFYLQLKIQHYTRRRNSTSKGFLFPRVGQFFNAFYSQCLPFPLTGAQKRVIKEIRADMVTGRQMNRLLQGDVGSGKTLVALLCSLIALDNDHQACIMAPTEILASQHFDTFSKMLAPIGVNVKLLTGSTRKKERDAIHEQLTDGSLHILIGTHAVIEDNVEFRNLGFVVIDEQHRFGVAQRAKMWKKNIIPPHVLVMTATPIPRTLAMTVYGDLSVSVIDELPPGRKPVKTLLRYENNRFEVDRAIGKELRQGRQVYIVFPLISENEKLDLQSLEEGYERVCNTFPSYRVAYVHGRMKPAEKDAQMELFASHQADILVATTVIEVGVNVPNATTMVIENAERFGLSQLHQIRGRVGRGGDQSYCVLMTKYQIAKETRRRLELMTSTTDGFEIAEADLQMRGPGDLEGTMQSGIAINLKIASLAADGQITQIARENVDTLLDADPELSLPEHRILVNQMHQLFDQSVDWSSIS